MRISFKLRRLMVFSTNISFKAKLLIQPEHGPSVWPWWKLVSLKVTNLNPSTESYGVYRGWRLWVYRPSGAFCIDVFYDKRPR